MQNALNFGIECSSRHKPAITTVSVRAYIHDVLRACDCVCVTLSIWQFVERHLSWNLISEINNENKRMSKTEINWKWRWRVNIVVNEIELLSSYNPVMKFLLVSVLSTHLNISLVAIRAAHLNCGKYWFLFAVVSNNRVLNPIRNIWSDFQLKRCSRWNCMWKTGRFPIRNHFMASWCRTL